MFSLKKKHLNKNPFFPILLSRNRWFHDLKLHDLLNNAWTNMSKSRNIWILAQRNDDPNKPSMLIILKNVTLSSPNSTTPWQSTCVAYIENDIKQRMKITPMYYDDYKWINVPRMKKEFQKWSDLNIVKQEDINSWNILFSKMSNTLENSCEECCILKQNTAMQNDRKCQKFSPDEVCFFFTHCTQCSKFCYN